MTSGDWNTTSPGRILIVDDAPENIQILHQTLKDEHEVFFATSGAQALQLANQLEPDLILLDVIMPGMNGYQVCKELKQASLTKEIPVIFITALNEEHDETAAFAVGGVDYIAKPIRPAVVKARVKTHLMLKRQREFLSRLSLVDGLTGVCNRRHFDERMRLEWRRAHRNNSTLAIIMADVDHFKRFNDTYGHQAGD
ncbi:MAG: response regulator, partial [Magnetococcales bacterium]|nr:response regulator [Magnetococcales bacterium]